ncbi:Gfo/Idh/MocA family protein [Nocardioides iriomotensis]|uniref:Gfo/Idh/MocA family oxidoreductase n=1 Tax=Nocardioides iriomotensis TaxID=715784 RepID=A0A4V1Z2P1_9ACTN|nr:Gfo/Idh/MocA family oxidoreductase [Nocardioides iriomotensis]RYU15086.1 Gfo/Idh/MocA family oxidoreductase [Nocardioides iriomotensis]
MTDLGVGLVGAGRFATFIAEAAADLPGLAWRGVADPDAAAAEVLATRLAVPTVAEWRDLLDDPAVDAVVIASPPATHAEIVRAAIESGRHVFCEKPLATGAAEALELARLADREQRALVVDHVLRYNPLLRALLPLRGSLLGPVQRFCFENDASDEDLHAGHWFWDASRSGGIFVEHGVHFFDAAAMLVDRPATSVQASAARRKADAPPDLVSATVTHAPDVLATHTHGFSHAHRCERQLMRIDFGNAEVRVEGWIPVEGVIDAWTDDAGVAAAEALPDQAPEGLVATPVVTRDAGTPSARGRGRSLEVPHHVRVQLSLGGHAAKMNVYAASVRAAVADLVHCARSGDVPVSNGWTAAAAVVVAEAATTAAATGGTVALSPG